MSFNKILFFRSESMYNDRTHQRSKDILDVPIDSCPTSYELSEDCLFVKCNRHSYA